MERIMRADPFPAHINGDTIQSCYEHNCGTAVHAQNDISDIGLSNTGYLAGILHDCGKYSEEFKDYIISAAKGKNVRKGSIIHSFAGVAYVLSAFHEESKIGTYEALTAELIAYAIGSHHGLFDCIDENKKNGFIHRMTKQPLYDKHAAQLYLEYSETEEQLKELFDGAVQEIIKTASELIELVKDSGNQKVSEFHFYIGILARLLTSAVIDGDRTDTARFMSGSIVTSYPEGNNSFWEKSSSSLENLINSFPRDTEIQLAREKISELCLDFSSAPSGIYRLNVPTGGGKTLSSLRMAIAHARKYGKKRIIYAAPFISILDQNAQVIREAINNDSAVLIHHSNIVHSKDGEDVTRYELLTQTWDAPVIVTTLVQVLNTFFSGDTSCVRRFQALCNSVLIIDEVQSVPSNMLSLFNLTLNFVSKIMGVNVILCSATQPCFEQLEHRLNVSDREVIDKETFESLSKTFKRTEIINKGICNIAEVRSLAKEILTNTNSLLIICNTKAEASEIFTSLKGICKNSFHISASMCMRHRKTVLRDLFNSLRTDQKTICVSTQVIEAGVDISFGAVIRVIAGIDSIVQAAGRCNRNGEYGEVAPVYIIRYKEERLGELADIKKAQNAAEELFYRYSENPSEFKNDLSSNIAVDFYYHKLFEQISNEHGFFDYPVKDTTLFDLLSDNTVYSSGSDGYKSYTLRQAFKTAGSLFEVIEKDSETVIVPYGEGRDIIAALLSEKAKHDLAVVKELLESARDYTVTAYRWQIKRLIRAGGIHMICDDTVMILDDQYYSSSLGLITDLLDEQEES